jgi:hypothetical protein
MIAIDRLTSLIDAYGADPERWPADERAAALLLLANSAEAQAYARDAGALDSVLNRVPLRPTVMIDPAALAAQITRTPARRPAGQVAWSSRRAFGFGWPNFAALAAAAIVGFVVGWTDLNNSTTVTNRDVVDIISPVAAVDDSVW